MLNALQGGIDYKYKKIPCKTHNKNLRAKNYQVVSKICKKCGFPTIANKTRKTIGVYLSFIDGIIIHGKIKIKN